MTPTELRNALREPVTGPELSLLATAHFKQLISVAETASQYATHMRSQRGAFDAQKSMAILTRLRGQLNSLGRIHDPNLKKISPENVKAVNNYLSSTRKGF
jgi:hypothetical protein